MIYDVYFFLDKAITSQIQNGESARLHTFNDFKLEIPYGDIDADECTWLLATDLPEGIIDAYLTKSSLFIGMIFIQFNPKQ